MNTKPKGLMVGSDPECFLFNKIGELVSSIGIIPGSKEHPTKTANGYILPDNITAEFNSVPADNAEDFIRNHQLILKDLNDLISPLDLQLNFIASVVADESLLSDPAARQAGCSIDYNAWSCGVNETPDYSNSNVRAAGGHLHISFDQASDTSDDYRTKFVRALDLVLGVPSVLYDDDVERRKLYGKAGSFRPKIWEAGDPYDGVEYRTLSNFWLRSEELMRWAFNGVKRVYENLEELSSLAESLSDDIIDSINNSNKAKAIQICEKVGINYAII